MCFSPVKSRLVEHLKNTPCQSLRKSSQSISHDFKDDKDSKYITHSKYVNFTFSLELPRDGKFGSEEADGFSET